MTPVSLKSPEFLRRKLEGMIGVRVISYLLPDVSPFRCSCFKTIWVCYENFPYSDHSSAKLKVNKIKYLL